MNRNRTRAKKEDYIDIAVPSESAAAAPIARATRVSDLPEFLTVDEFADYMQIGRGLAYELARSDSRLRAVRLGRLLRISREAITALANDEVVSAGPRRG